MKLALGLLGKKRFLKEFPIPVLTKNRLKAIR
jgi:hypothetical protein